MCDAVQDEHYLVDGVAVSNFLLPLYFTRDAEKGGRNDFLGRLGADGIPLASFGINEGGYVGFFNPKSRKHETFALEGDTKAKKRLRIKSKANLTRRSMRYKSGVYYQERVDTTIRVPDDRRRPRRGPMRAAAPRPTRPVEMIDSATERPTD
jgi:hypothetical protein